jgi:hypothetical protein
MAAMMNTTPPKNALDGAMDGRSIAPPAAQPHTANRMEGRDFFAVCSLSTINEAVRRAA